MSDNAKATHTPGPWTCSIGTKGSHVDVGNDHNHPLSFGFTYSENLYPEAAANARLIAAAPEMLEALRKVVDLVESEIGYDATSKDEGERDYAQRMIAARAAIAKAEGRDA